MLKSIAFEGSSSALGKWEDAGESLANALSTYLRSCMFLETFSPKHDVDAQHLALRIDFSLNALHTKLSEELAQSRVILARMRNKTLCRFYSLPNEIVASIFMDVVYAPAPNDQLLLPMAEAVKVIFRRLYKLLSVCSSWRNFGIGLNELWSVIPMPDHSGGQLTSEATSSILKRSGASSFRDRPLHLAAILPYDYNGYIPLVDGKVPRFTSINIQSDCNHLISRLIEHLLRHQPHFALSELSIHQVRYEEGEPDYFPELPAGFIMSNRSTNHDLFTNLIGSLSILRINGVNIWWGEITFSDKLVELRLQSVVLDDKSMLLGFLQVLRSAPELQQLKIISVVALSGLDSDSDLDEPQPSDTPVAKYSFPKLRSLLLGDLDFYTLNILLDSIVPGSHHTRLCLTAKSRRIYDLEEGHVDVDMQLYFGLLERSRVDTLIIDGTCKNVLWLGTTGLRRVLQALPTLKTLKIGFWTLHKQDLQALERPQSVSSDPDVIPFPSLESLCIIGTIIWDTEALSRVATSHPLQTMELGGRIPTSGPDEWAILKDDHQVVRQLRATVPHFQLVNDILRIEDFNEDMWRLW